MKLAIFVNRSLITDLMVYQMDVGVVGQMVVLEGLMVALMEAGLVGLTVVLVGPMGGPLVVGLGLLEGLGLVEEAPGQMVAPYPDLLEEEVVDQMVDLALARDVSNGRMNILM